MNNRKHITTHEVQKPMAATKGSRNEARDRYLLLLIFRHGLLISEACALTLAQVDVENRVLNVARLKKGLSTRHPLRTDEIKVIMTCLPKCARISTETDAFFVSERRAPLSRKRAWAAIRDYGELAGLPLHAHPHQLRQAYGFVLADHGADTRVIQDYLGHRNIQHTVIYTAANPARFERLWRRTDFRKPSKGDIWIGHHH